MADEEGSLNRTSVGICVTSAQHFHVVIVIVVVDGTVERQQNHLRNLERAEWRHDEISFDDIHNDVEINAHIGRVNVVMNFGLELEL